MKLAKHITLTGDGHLLIDGVEFGYHLADQGVTVIAGSRLSLVTVTVLAEGFDFDPCPPQITADRKRARPRTPDAPCLHSWARQIADRFGDEWEHTGGCQGNPLEMGGCPLCCILAATSPNATTPPKET